MALGGFNTIPNNCDAIEKITLADGNESMKLVDGILYSYDMKTVIWCPAKYNKTTVIIPNGVHTIAPNSFDSCVNIEEIEMPTSVRYIGYWAFINASSLKLAAIPEGCEIIGQFAYSGTGVESIHIPASVEVIRPAAFSSGFNIKTITVDENNEFFYMQDGALIARDLVNGEGNDVMLDYETENPATSFTIPSQVATIEQYAFAHANNLNRIIIPNNVKSIEAYAFESCLGITHIEFPDSMTEIGIGLYLYCYNLASVIIPSTVTYIDSNVGSDTDQYTIYGTEGSYAQTYAVENNINFKPVSEFNPECENSHSMKKVVLEDRYQYVCENCGDKSIIHWRTNIDSVANGVILSGQKFVYNGKEQKPALDTFIYSYEDYEREFKKGVDYTIKGYEDNVNAGTGYIVIEGIGEYYGEGRISFEIKPVDVNELTIKLEYTSIAYNGGNNQPLVTVAGLKEFEDFQVAYENNVKPGTATVKINFWGNYSGEVIKTFQIYLPATSKLSASLYGNDDVSLTWNKVNGASGYYVYYKKSSSSSYIYKGTTTNLSYKIANLSDNTSYTFKVCAYYKKGSSNVASSKYKTVSISTLRDLKAPSKLTLSLYEYNKVKVSWSKVSYAKGYYVYYKKSTSKSYTYAGKTTGTSFNKANLSAGANYYFKVVPYGVSGSKIILDDSYKTASIYTLKKLATPKVTKSTSKAVKITWTNIAGESGYQISKSTKKSGESVVSTVSTTTGKSATVSATKGKGYYYKVRAFKKVGSKVVYGPWSTAKYYKLK